MVSSKPTYEEILDIVTEVTSIFNRCGYDCCLFGSVACALYGVSRPCPDDADIIVFTDDDQEHLKQLVVDEDSSFYLRRPRDRRKPYKKLYYRLPSPRRGPKRWCKIDILTPWSIGMNIPDMPPQHIKRRYGFPVLPIVPLLLLKLQGWEDHGASERSDFQAKQPLDVEDINGLLDIACDLGTHIHSQSLRWLPDDFVEEAQRRVHEYVEEYSFTYWQWEKLGFDAW